VTAGPLRLRCHACGTEVDPLGPSPWACPRPVDDDGDHVLVVPLPTPDAQPDASTTRSFLRYRRRLASWRAATGAGLDDAELVRLIEGLDDRVAAVAGRGFGMTPASWVPSLAASLGAGEVWLKDETGNVSGSHKGRHLFGLAIWLAVRGRLGAADPDRLAIASCGNAALAAATIAAAIARPLAVFVPTWANPAVLARLSALGAEVVVCEREPGELGDPCVRRCRAEVAAGAVPFGCTGPDVGLTIDGGRTLGWELAEQVPGLDRVVAQVGGGALGTAVSDGFRIAGALPRIDTVQPAGCAPFARAVEVARVHGLDAALAHRSTAMWPWEVEPASVATGILDDETYDWGELARAVLDSGGRALVASEEQLAGAHRLVHEHTTIDADHTGCAGLAGLAVDPPASGERVAVLLTGATR